MTKLNILQEIADNTPEQEKKEDLPRLNTIENETEINPEEITAIREKVFQFKNNDGTDRPTKRYIYEFGTDKPAIIIPQSVHNQILKQTKKLKGKTHTFTINKEGKGMQTKYTVTATITGTKQEKLK